MILVLSGIGLIAKSDKKMWIKLVTIIVVPIISVFLFVVSLFALSNETM
mgnify:FL=1